MTHSIFEDHCFREHAVLFSLVGVAEPDSRLWSNLKHIWLGYLVFLIFAFISFLFSISWTLLFQDKDLETTFYTCYSWFMFDHWSFMWGLMAQFKLWSGGESQWWQWSSNNLVMVIGGFPWLVQYSIIATNRSLQGRSMLRWSPYSFIKWLLARLPPLQLSASAYEDKQCLDFSDLWHFSDTQNINTKII